MIRFLHTSDWQLGMTRHFLSEGAQERYSQARFDAIRTMGRIAKDEECQSGINWLYFLDLSLFVVLIVLFMYSLDGLRFPKMGTQNRRLVNMKC